jgi:hypothetical protein
LKLLRVSALIAVTTFGVTVSWREGGRVGGREGGSAMMYRSVFLNLCETAAQEVLFFIRQGPRPNKFTHQYLLIFLSSYIKLT